MNQFTPKGNLNLVSTDHGYIASLDILGFSALVKNNKHSYLIELFDSFVNSVHEKNVIINETYLKEVDNNLTEEIKSLIVSDTILLYTESAEIESFLKIVLLIQMLLTNSFLKGIPLRGCLTEGNITVKHSKNNDMVFGRAIVEAYEEEKNQEWAGCCITTKCIEAVEKFHVNKNKPCINWLEERNDIVKYSIPLKNNKSEIVFAINWTKTGKYMGLEESLISKSFYDHNKEPMSSKEMQKTTTKINNTIEFWKQNNT